MASRRLASGSPSAGSTEPQPTKISRLPSISITPQPVRRRPGSMPRMRTGWRIGWDVMGFYNPRASAKPRAGDSLSAHLGDQRVGNLEIGEHVLHVVVLVQQVDQF